MRTIDTPRMKAKRYNAVLRSLAQREAHCWNAVLLFYENRDAHGVMDMGSELQALQRARAEVEKAGKP